NDKQHGFGKATYADGTVKEGLWKNGEFNTLEEHIKLFVEQKVNQWQLKGEFEKTTVYEDRISESNRNARKKEFEREAIESLKATFVNSIDFSNIELDPYDADNETFLLKTKDSKLGNLVISVPINEAQKFKENFSRCKFLNPQCVIIDDKFVLSHVDVVYGNNTYHYDK
ncbi:MAG: hypothetical protein O2781_03315, partial [Bacteroidetes bacterium]|nr:hypothetical protein [Bacteroidota bacterium]